MLHVLVHRGNSAGEFHPTNPTTRLSETGAIKAIEATGMDRVATSQYYARRTNYTFNAVKTTALIDC